MLKGADQQGIVMEFLKKTLLLTYLICFVSGCVTEKDLQEMKRSDWIDNDPGILAPKEIVPEKDH